MRANLKSMELAKPFAWRELAVYLGAPAAARILAVFVVMDASSC
jgi:hypothetical protein